MWFVRHIPGILCLILVYTALVVVNITVVYSSDGVYFHLFFFELLVVLFIITHFRAICTNPGLLDKHYTSLDPVTLPPPFSMVMEQRAQSAQLPSDPQRNRSLVQKSRNQIMSTPGLISHRHSFFETKTEMSQGAESLAEMIDISLQRYLGHNPIDGTETSRSEATSDVQLKLDERGLPSSNQQSIHVWKKRVKQILNRKCATCDSMKPPRTHHCRVCERCIVRMDHHCPWINNCVGFYNQKHFLQFLVIACISTAYSALFLMIKIGLTFADGDIGTLVGNPVSKFKIGTGLLSIICSILFFYFALALFFDQLSCIAHNTSAIDRIQTRKLTTKLTFEESFQEVFGGPLSCSWFLPTSVKKKIQPEEEYLWANLN